MSTIADLAGIRVVECPWMEPGKLYLFNDRALREPLKIPMQLLDIHSPRSFDLMRHVYAPFRIMPDRAMMLCAETMIDPPKPWSPRKSRGPRRRSRRSRR